MQIEIKGYIFLSVQQLRQIATSKCKLRCETGLLNTSTSLLRVVALGAEVEEDAHLLRVEVDVAKVGRPGMDFKSSF